jgi:hypothetical protein
VPVQADVEDVGVVVEALLGPVAVVDGPIDDQHLPVATKRLGVSVMFTIFGDFDQFSAKKMAFFLKTEVLVKHFESKSAIFPPFSAKYRKNCITWTSATDWLVFLREKRYNSLQKN